MYVYYTTLPGARDLAAGGEESSGTLPQRATLLLNAGAPVLTVQALLGHKFVDTTLGYARLYDSTIAADYYRAMAQVEKQLVLQPDAEPPITPGHLLAMVDALQAGTLNDSQQETVLALREAILNLAG